MRKNDPSKLIKEYFKVDIETLDIPIHKKTYIYSTFFYAISKKLTLEQISEELEGSEIESIRNSALKAKTSNYNPFPIRLGDLKPYLLREAWDLEMSVHSLILNIISKYKEISVNGTPDLKKFRVTRNSYIRKERRDKIRIHRYKTDYSETQLAFPFKP